MIPRVAVAWSFTAAKSEVNDYVAPGFVYKGEGWYVSKLGEFLLIRELPSGLIEATCYVSDPRDEFSALIAAPIKHDERESNPLSRRKADEQPAPRAQDPATR